MLRCYHCGHKMVQGHQRNGMTRLKWRSYKQGYGLEKIWRNLLGAGVNSTARNASPSDDTSGLYGQNQDVQSLSKVFKLTIQSWLCRMFVTELGSATNNFSPSNIIGEGRFGTVYKGRLRDGRLVAIKRKKIDAFEQSLSAEYRTFVEMLSQVDHLNVVKLSGYMEEGSERMVVVEYVSNGNLQEHLDGTCGTVLDMSTRLDIATDVAHALMRLQLYAEGPILVPDIRASNILLADTYRAKEAMDPTKKR